MPRLAVPLTDPQIRALQPRAARYSIADGNGLVLEVMPTGNKVWRFRYTLDGTRQPTVTIGDYLRISLRVARARAQKYAEMVASGQSPVAAARQDRGAEKRVETVRDAIELYLGAGLHGQSEVYLRTNRRVFEKDVLPTLGSRAVAEIGAADVGKIIKRIGERGSPKMALHTRNVIKRLYDYLIERQLVSVNPVQMESARFVATSASRTRVLTAQEIGTALRTIYASDIRRPLKLALHLLVLTMVRKTDLIDARWTEFNLRAAIWQVGSACEESGETRTVTLSRQAVAILQELRAARTSTTYVFPTVRGDDRPIARSTLNQAVKALGLPVEQFVLHDFRNTAASVAGRGDSIDKAGAAEDTDVTHIAVDLSAMEVAQRWADFVDAQIRAVGGAP